jgi:hypothetical protein
VGPVGRVRLRVSFSISCLESLPGRRCTTLSPRLSARLFLIAVGAVGPVGRRWCSIYFPGKGLPVAKPSLDGVCFTHYPDQWLGIRPGPTAPNSVA